MLRCAAVTKQLVAGKVTVALLDAGTDAFHGATTDSIALFVVYVAVTAVPSGPKLDPNRVTTWLPAVKALADPAPSKEEMIGEPYDVGPTVLFALWPATVTDQYSPGPMPGAVTHCS